jgi:hypothetical protein
MSRILNNPIHAALLFALLSLAFAVPIHPQSDPANPNPAEPKLQANLSARELHQTPAVDPKAEPSPSATLEETRQARIEADTKRLLLLSAELRAEVAKTYKESLSLTVLKKAEEVEKLAGSLKSQLNQEAAASKH